MSIAVVVAIVYISVAGVLYYKDRRLMAALERYIRDTGPVNEALLKAAFLVMTALLPLEELYYLLKRLWSRKRNNHTDDQIIRAFLDEYYPELLSDLEKTTVFIDSADDIDKLLSYLNDIFDDVIAAPVYERLRRAVFEAEEDVDRNCRATQQYKGEMINLIFKVSLREKQEGITVDIFAPANVIDNINILLNNFCHKANESR